MHFLQIISAVSGGITDLSFDAVGYAWQIMNCILTASYSVRIFNPCFLLILCKRLLSLLIRSLIVKLEPLFWSKDQLCPI
jgi:hypothetical protein